jgi:cobalt-precorrin-7 (C5)-methyltransferase
VGKVYVVGVGPGSPDYVIPLARKTVHLADVVIGAQRSLDLFTSDICGQVVVLTAKNLNEVLHNAAEFAQAGKVVALLSTGDPGFSGLLRSFLNNTLDYNIEVSVIPAISSVQVCAARLNLSWDDLALFTFHDLVTVEKKVSLLDHTKASKGVLLFPNQKTFPPKEIANYLMSNGLAENTPVFICENLTLPDEKITQTTLTQVSKQDFAPLCVMVITPFTQNQKTNSDTCIGGGK